MPSGAGGILTILAVSFLAGVDSALLCSLRSVKVRVRFDASHAQAPLAAKPSQSAEPSFLAAFHQHQLDLTTAAPAPPTTHWPKPARPP